MARRKVKDKTVTNKRIYTLVLVLLVLIVAFLARGFLVYRLYPLEHQQIIAQKSEEYALDPYLVSAVIRAESGFRIAAVSPKGAVGLMQIIPGTGAWIAEKLKMDDYDAEMLTDPHVNIEFGCWYLNYLYGRFSGDEDKMLAAYNAGPNKVDTWIEGGVLGDIPYPETENYVKTVKRNYYIYKGLYDDF